MVVSSPATRAVPFLPSSGGQVALYWVGGLTVAVHDRAKRIGYISLVGSVYVAYLGARHDRMVEVAQHLSMTEALEALRRAAPSGDAVLPDTDSAAPRSSRTLTPVGLAPSSRIGRGRTRRLTPSDVTPTAASA